MTGDPQGILSILVKAAEKGACNCGYYNGTTTNANTETNTYKQNENEDKGKDMYLYRKGESRTVFTTIEKITTKQNSRELVGRSM